MDLAASFEELRRQNEELVRTVQELVRQNQELARRLDRVETEYYKHGHSTNNALPN